MIVLGKKNLNILAQLIPFLDNDDEPFRKGFTFEIHFPFLSSNLCPFPILALFQIVDGISCRFLRYILMGYFIVIIQ